MTPLAVHRYQFNCRTLEPVKFGFYAGSMLRGAFGKALRKTVCVTKMNDCKACLLYRQCTYTKLFETPPKPSEFQKFSQIPNPYILEPPPLGEKQLDKGETFSFNLVLIGQALEYLPIVIFSMQTALTNGLGIGHSSAELIDVVFEPGQAIAKTIYSAVEQTLLPNPRFSPEIVPDCDSIHLQLLTPLRIQQKGQILAATMSGKDFLMALVRRYYLLQEFHGSHYQPPDFNALAKYAAKIDCHNRFHWCEWVRYSHRQQQKMTFRGVIGDMQFHGDMSPFLQLLTMGQWLHVGNKTTFGMGHYLIT